MLRHAGATRFIYNHLLQKHEEYYEQNHENWLCGKMCKYITQLKEIEKYNWLKEISAFTLKQTARNLDDAYMRFYKKINGHPKFKSKKKSKISFPVRGEAKRMYFIDNTVKLEKIGFVKYKSSHDFSEYVFTKYQTFYNCRINKTNNKWILHVTLTSETQAVKLTDKVMGIDIGIKEFATICFGEEKIVYHNINKSQKIRKLKSKLKHLHRKLSKKYLINNYKNTNNILKYQNIIKKIYYKLSCIREDYICKIVNKIVNMKPSKIVVEKLNVEGLLKNKHISESVREQMFYTFFHKLKNKCEFYGIEFIRADRYYPSSKKCSNCGNVKKYLKLSERTYICEHCGLEIDRDFNAAINLMNYGINNT